MRAVAGSGAGDDSTQGWRKSSRSMGSGACVEAAGPSPDHIRVRDSVDPHGLVLQVTPAGWTAFLGDVVSGKLPRS
jgi:hypothetical protein